MLYLWFCHQKIPCLLSPNSFQYTESRRSIRQCHLFYSCLFIWYSNLPTPALLASNLFILFSSPSSSCLHGHDQRHIKQQPDLVPIFRATSNFFDSTVSDMVCIESACDGERGLSTLKHLQETSEEQPPAKAHWVHNYIEIPQSTKGPICVSYTVFHDPVGRSSCRENTYSLWRSTYWVVKHRVRDTNCSFRRLWRFYSLCLSLRIEHCLFGGLSSSCIEIPQRTLERPCIAFSEGK